MKQRSRAQNITGNLDAGLIAHLTRKPPPDPTLTHNPQEICRTRANKPSRSPMAAAVKVVA